MFQCLRRRLVEREKKTLWAVRAGDSPRRMEVPG